MRDRPASSIAIHPRPAELRLARRVRAEALASCQAGVVSRPQLYAAGVTRAEVRANLRAARWRQLGRQTVAVFTGPLTREAEHWRAVLEGGPRAVLDGESALEAEGLEHYTVERIRVSVPRGARVRRVPGVDIRQTRRWREEDRQPTGVPRTRPHVAAVRAALWARSDKQAALVLTMTVQQGLTTAERIGSAMLRVRRDKRRTLVHAVLLDLLGGARTLSEAEFARECRRRGFPAPDQHVLRRGKDGRVYLDVVWEQWRVVVEIDGIQHSWAQNVVADALRQNAVSLGGAVVLRLPLLGLRVAADEFFAQIGQTLVDRGCPVRGHAVPGDDRPA